MEEKTQNTGHGMGVAALIIGIISIVVAFIPCLGLLAFFTAVVAIVLGAIGISQASRANAPKGTAIGGLVTGGLALFITIAQIVFFASFSDRMDFAGDRIEEIFEDIGDDVMEDMENSEFKITIEDGEDKVEIQGSGNKENLKEKLEKLEGIEEESKDPDTTGK
ncbi:MAG TPA: DUF4190 domain-containing protein [Bacteroidales bacterium]|nr:DUF4190 domain-containing protein [Bacteroidales bacterium]